MFLRFIKNIKIDLEKCLRADVKVPKCQNDNSMALYPVLSDTSLMKFGKTAHRRFPDYRFNRSFNYFLIK